MPPEAPDWVTATRAALQDARLGAHAEYRGRVEEIGDGVAMISGLNDVRLDEVLRFEHGQVGFARVLDPDRIGCVLLDAVRKVEAGDAVFGTGEVVNVPVGDALLGRIVDPLGRPLDGKGVIEAEAHLPIERPAPSIIERDLVTEPVQTGVVVVDTLFALGRGQRELIVGDHSTGKTTLAIDALIAQRDSDMICIYVAVGQKTSSVRRAIDALQKQGNFARCIVLVAGAASAPGLQWIAPYAGMTMAEHFRDKGQHALIVIDDLSKHAATHREIALLTRQSPGREAYPGDVFYIHARLLERAAKLSKARGGGSLTALPIAETVSGNLSAYIPTNLISITDGQIVLDAALFHQGQKPAVDVGLSVSRVGGKTQAPILRTSAGTLRLDYAQFLELEVFTRFGGMPDGRVREQLTRGARIRQALRQPQHMPFRLADEVALMLAVQSGLLDPLPLEAVKAFRAGLPDLLDRDAADVLATLEQTGDLDAQVAGRPDGGADADLPRHSARQRPKSLKLKRPQRTRRCPAHDRTARRYQRPDRRHPSAWSGGERHEGHRCRPRQQRAIAGSGRRQLCRDHRRCHVSHGRSKGRPVRRANGSQGKNGLLVFCAEQGFAGAFSERVLDSVRRRARRRYRFPDRNPGAVGRGSTRRQAEMDTPPCPRTPRASRSWPTRSRRRSTMRSRWAEIARLDVIFTGWHAGRPEIVRHGLFPLDLADLPGAQGDRPLTQLPHGALCSAWVRIIFMRWSARPPCMPLPPRTRRGWRR